MPPVWLFSVIRLIRNFFIKSYYRFIPPGMAVFEKSQGFWIAKAISVACELNLAEIIGEGEKSIDEISMISKTDPEALYRLIRALASEGIFKEVSPKMFKNNRFSNTLKDAPGNLKNMIMHQLNQTNWEVVNELKYSVVSGDNAAQRLLGTDIFTHLRNTPEKNTLYNKAMSETSGYSSSAIVSAYSFNGFETIADIGGGEGALLKTILYKYPKLKGILFDLPHVVNKAGEQVIIPDLKDRLQITSGNFFEDELPIADAYILKNILHAFDDDTCIKLLKSVKTAMKKTGKLLVIEAVISEDNKPAFGKLFDLQMLIGSENGKERTANEFNVIFEKAGFSLKRVVKTVSPFSIIEGIRT